jgi:hypothetical protein
MVACAPVVAGEDAESAEAELCEALAMSLGKSGVFVGEVEVEVVVTSACPLPLVPAPSRVDLLRALDAGEVGHLTEMFHRTGLLATEGSVLSPAELESANQASMPSPLLSTFTASLCMISPIW